MTVQFSTTDRNTALSYLQRLFPSKVITEVTAKPILDMLDHKIRIGDPSMYGGNLQVFPVYESEFDEIQNDLLDWYGKLSLKEANNEK